tara:strand:- start:434 stop:634 length:201 start_codon:yes stop_codon:yes gene_type:complete
MMTRLVDVLSEDRKKVKQTPKIEIGQNRSTIAILFKNKKQIHATNIILMAIKILRMIVNVILNLYR